MRVILFAMACGLALGVPAMAQDTGGTAPKKEKKICKAEAMTGSILGGKRVCRTKAEWDAMTAASAQDLDRNERELSGRDGGLGVQRGD